ncbi:alpha/beta fold hydrolase [Streptomyces sp. A012304]|uniref:alpha/beta fold hydrolase n=1 Tax=Streptomyces sp. A012304 TaxID=375446 RepID=UPI002230B160|nr:alpha/beta hydrolase [Streptomyces sp. A012304]GKQ36595.1 alpha/beta hydrolase [Streptomyces sp. A012304]
MARRIEVTGAGGVRLVAWEFGDPPKGDPPDTGPQPAIPAQSAGDRTGPHDADTTDPADFFRSTDPFSPTAPTPGVLLLHGLMGRASHWASTARWLCERHRAIALDQRGHGQSEKPPQAAFTREAYVEDAEAALEQLGLAPAVLIGHAMGALTAWQLAAKRPDLVSGVIICDMRASALGAASQREWADWFKSWPVPFATLADVRKWFGEDDPWVERPNPARGAFYAEVMHESADGWRPVFEPEQMLKSRETWVYDAHWEELTQVRCPTLVVRGLDGELGRAEAQEMVRVLPRGEYAEVADAGHLVHYDQPEAWRAAIEPFLDGVLTP